MITPHLLDPPHRSNSLTPPQTTLYTPPRAILYAYPCSFLLWHCSCKLVLAPAHSRYVSSSLLLLLAPLIIAFTLAPDPPSSHPHPRSQSISMSHSESSLLPILLISAPLFVCSSYSLCAPPWHIPPLPSPRTLLILSTVHLHFLVCASSYTSSSSYAPPPPQHSPPPLPSPPCTRLLLLIRSSSTSTS